MHGVHARRPAQTPNHPTQMVHHSASGAAFRDWPVQRQKAADARSGLCHRQRIPAYLVRGACAAQSCLTTAPATAHARAFVAPHAARKCCVPQVP